MSALAQASVAAEPHLPSAGGGRRQKQLAVGLRIRSSLIKSARTPSTMLLAEGHGTACTTTQGCTSERLSCGPAAHQRHAVVAGGVVHDGAVDVGEDHARGCHGPGNLGRLQWVLSQARSPSLLLAMDALRAQWSRSPAARHRKPLQDQQQRQHVDVPVSSLDGAGAAREFSAHGERNLPDPNAVRRRHEPPRLGVRRRRRELHAVHQRRPARVRGRARGRARSGEGCSCCGTPPCRKMWSTPYPGAAALARHPSSARIGGLLRAIKAPVEAGPERHHAAARVMRSLSALPRLPCAALHVRRLAASALGSSSAAASPALAALGGGASALLLGNLPRAAVHSLATAQSHLVLQLDIGEMPKGCLGRQCRRPVIEGPHRCAGVGVPLTLASPLVLHPSHTCRRPRVMMGATMY